MLQFIGHDAAMREARRPGARSRYSPATARTYRKGPSAQLAPRSARKPAFTSATARDTRGKILPASAASRRLAALAAFFLSAAGSSNATLVAEVATGMDIAISLALESKSYLEA